MYYIIIKSESYNSKHNRPANHWSIYDKNRELAIEGWTDEAEPIYNYSQFSSTGYIWNSGYKTAEGALKAARQLTRGYPADVVYGVTDAEGAAELLFRGGRK